MKNIPVKFRGKAVVNGVLVYGDLLHSRVAHSYGGGVKIRPVGEREVKVVPESVAQLVGYDVAGNEIYEGDEVYCYQNLGNYSAEDLKKSEPVDIAKVTLEVEVTNKKGECFDLLYGEVFLKKE